MMHMIIAYILIDFTINFLLKDYLYSRETLEAMEFGPVLLSKVFFYFVIFFACIYI